MRFRLRGPFVHGFEFRDVSFRLSRERAAWSSIDLNFHLQPGERVALIGENGQGKTTIVKLITRLYDPTEGQILLDGVDLREYDLEDLYREIGVIFQDFMRYEMTARENIAVGKNRGVARISPRLQYAAEKSLADEVIAKLPAGTTRCSAGVSKAESISPAASGRRSLWPAPICAIRNC